jgi:CRP-like cAMP-binding protein
VPSSTPAAIATLGLRGALVALGLVGPLLVLLSWQALRRLDGRMLARDDDIRLLQMVPMLRPLPQATIEQLAADSKRAVVAAGHPVRPGDPGEHFYLIADGEAEILDNGPPIKTLGNGDGFGEIALLSGRPHTSTVRAIGDRPLQLSLLAREPFLTAVTGYSHSSAAAARFANP